MARLHASALKQCADRGSTLLGKLLIHFRRPRRVGIAVYGHVQIRKIDELINVLLKRLFGRRAVGELACAECKREGRVALVELELIADEDRLAVFVQRDTRHGDYRDGGKLPFRQNIVAGLEHLAVVFRQRNPGSFENRPVEAFHGLFRSLDGTCLGVGRLT